MSTRDKPREFWIDPTPDGHDELGPVLMAFDNDPSQGLSDHFVHVIEYSAFQKVVNTLKWIANESDLQHCIDEANQTLKELGVLE